jgi:hypothetical protein
MAVGALLRRAVVDAAVSAIAALPGRGSAMGRRSRSLAASGLLFKRDGDVLDGHAGDTWAGAV